MAAILGTILSSRQLDAPRCFHVCCKMAALPRPAEFFFMCRLRTNGELCTSSSTNSSRAICMATTGNANATSVAEPKRRALAIPLLERDADGNIRMRSSAEVSGSPDKLEPRSIPVNLPAKRVPASKKVDPGPPKYSKAARRFYNEKFREPERLGKVLATAGVASRRASEEVIFAGRVTVNGTVCKIPQTPVDPLRDFIYIDGHSLPKKLPPKLFFALNKPKGYICSNGVDESKSVLSLFDGFIKSWTKKNPGIAQPRLFTVGRLDVGTAGLLLVTNDGEFANKVSHPSSGITKEYIATVDGEIVTRRQLNAVAQGTLVQGVLCVPKEVELLEGEADDKKKRLRIVVQALKRVRIGSLRLPRKLSVGKYQLLTEQQANKILDGIRTIPQRKLNKSFD
ncbi:hypothetical protein O6H91_04G030700 [Diphasiastrum complanatum]|uniref:Uncharacterized protein n=1 Tax=Diphasiastrum complanatum TaxID=34168 RepID=A0ACC2DVI7_DIPCM|nr:hypothetical protein O6H91_04G030700 [Diphasiastrum complanatum]